jgi:hypothetical protein
MVLEEPQVEQRRQLRIGDEDDVPASTAVAAVGTALRHVRLATKRDGPGAAVAAAQVDLDLVDER